MRTITKTKSKRKKFHCLLPNYELYSDSFVKIADYFSKVYSQKYETQKSDCLVQTGFEGT
jgi:hypothetical protein